MVYPSPKEVKHKLITAIRPSIVNIGIPSFSKISDRQAVDFYVNRGSQSLQKGLTVYHPGSSKNSLPHFNRDFNLMRQIVKKITTVHEVLVFEADG